MNREINLEEVKRHANEDSVWVIIHNNVYDLTKFLEEHPGGADSILEYGGQDGTQAFEDVAHSDDARELMKKFQIGTLPAHEQNLVPNSIEPSQCDTAAQLKRDVLVLSAHSSGVIISSSSSSRLKWALIALAGALVIGFAIRKYAKGG